MYKFIVIFKDHKNMFECEMNNYTIGYSPKLGACSYGFNLLFLLFIFSSPQGYRVIKLSTNPNKTV